MKNLVLIFLFVSVNFSSFSQTDSTLNKPLRFILEGTITDVATNEPIENAFVKLIGTDGSDTLAKTDSVGFYSFQLKPEFRYTIAISSTGYLNARGQVHVSIQYSTKYIHDFKLQPSTSCSLPFPSVIFTQNSFEGIQTSERNIPTDSLFFIIATMKDNPSLVIGVTGNRTAGEKPNISIKRAKWVKQHLINHDINKKRIKIIDGGIPEGSKNKRVVWFNVISADFNL